MDQSGNPISLEHLFHEAHAAYLASDGNGYPLKIVLARDIRIPEGFEPLPGRLDHMRPGFQNERRRFETPSAPPIAVVERADGSLWTYENIPMLSLFHEMASLARLQVVIIASELAKPESPSPFRHAPRRS